MTSDVDYHDSGDVAQIQQFIFCMFPSETAYTTLNFYFSLSFWQLAWKRSEVGGEYIKQNRAFEIAQVFSEYLVIPLNVLLLMKIRNEIGQLR